MVELNFKRKRIVLISFLPAILVLCFLSSCSYDKPAADKPLIKGEPEVAEIVSREAVFVCEENKNFPQKIVLRLAGEPVLFPSGYARLVGVVSGGKPMACFEVGGRGLALGEGEEIDNYRVVMIDENNVILKKEE